MKRCELAEKFDIEKVDQSDFENTVGVLLMKWNYCLKNWMAHLSYAEWNYVTDLTEEHKRKVSSVTTPGRRQSRTLILSRNQDQNSLETEFSIAIWRQIATETTVSIDFYSAFVDSVFDCHLPGVVTIKPSPLPFEPFSDQWNFP